MSSESNPTLPLEIVETVIDILAQDDQFDSRPTTAVFARLLSTTPKISDYIRKIHCHISSEAFDNPALPGILKQINKLESLSINWPGSLRQWSDNPLRSAMLHLLHLPTLIYLWLQDITDFVVSDLIPCSNLKVFDFCKIEAVELENPVASSVARRQVCLQRFSAWGRSSTTILKLCRSLGSSGKTIFDFSSISCISFFLYHPEELEATREFLNTAKNFVK
ncbi:hypothetical protein GALMADRAFT_146994 [Galerina marginata CBS 339.88]|uniref:F-box domain-containing protein n=1 Tax=Galerina marginata (strain CBS 339.88) TaxID=685588 RepID=A0A067S9Z4_GALM3|nr:hypothetical protein GALMADRAFT_146994 [Galerina marginata CBS 339.88]